jgi:hypothetical protein
MVGESVVLEPHAGFGVPVTPRYVGRSTKARRELRVANALAKGSWTPLFGDQLRSWSSSLSWRRPRPRSSWWPEQLSWWLLTLSARRRASMVFRTSRFGPRRLLTVDVAAPPPSLHSRCWEGGGFGPCADSAPAHLRSERWRETELSSCCTAAASSSAFSCWRTRRSSEVAASGQPRSRMAVVARFCDARPKSGGASASVLASTFAPSLARRLLSRVGPHAGAVGARARNYSAARRRSRRSPLPSRGSSCIGISCVGRRSQGSASIPSSW